MTASERPSRDLWLSELAIGRKSCRETDRSESHVPLGTTERAWAARAKHAEHLASFRKGISLGICGDTSLTTQGSTSFCSHACSMLGKHIVAGTQFFQSSTYFCLQVIFT